MWSHYTFILFVYTFFELPHCHGNTVRHTFVLRYEPKSPDGVFKRQVLTVNGGFPGPNIYATHEDTLEVDVVNLLQPDYPVSIHWHGIYQKGTPFQDGPAHITQCPLKAGHVQRYQFHLNQTGTYWYHAHLDSQYTEGLWGAIIIYPKNTPHEPDSEDVVITLSDWYHHTAVENEAWYLSPDSAGYPPYPSSALMNGHGRYPCPLAEAVGLHCNPSLQFRPVFSVHGNRTTRLRVINTSAHTTFNFTVESHSLLAVEVDGVDTVPVGARSASISVGQRYSFILQGDANKVPHGNQDFLVRANVWKDFTAVGSEDNYTNINPFPSAWMGDVTGVLRYRGEEEAISSDVDLEVHTYEAIVPAYNHTHFLEESLLAPANPKDRAPSRFDLGVHFTLDFVADGAGVIRGFLKDGPYSSSLLEDKPLIFQVAAGESIAKERRVIEVEPGAVVQIIVDNYTNRSHPLHLHGYHFYVVGKGEPHTGNFADSAELRLDGVKRDTVWIHANSWIVLRWVADNVGVWPFHCHIDWHMLSGMMVNFVVGKERIREMGVPYEAQRLCQL